MAFELPNLSFAHDALEPAIDTATMQIHHGKHHAAYVANLNKALEAYPDWAARDLDAIVKQINDVPEAIRNAVRNNGGGHHNHSLFWKHLGPNKGGEPAGELASQIATTFGSFASCKEALKNAGLARFGSGWAWLSAGRDGKLLVESTPNQDSPLMHGNTPILGIDVWEHAYYLRYQNRRADYLEAIFAVVDWDAVAANLAAAQK